MGRVAGGVRQKRGDARKGFFVTATVVIPARFGSTRFPAKILASDTGKPLVQHVVDRAKACKLARDVLVATDDDRIVNALRPFGTRCVMTSVAHPSGTDRIAEVARTLSDDIIVNVQGDEPEIEPATIDSLIELMQATSADMATACTPFTHEADVTNPNLVKVVMSKSSHGTTRRAIYFSRAAIPFRRDATLPSTAASPDAAFSLHPYHLHLGIYAYRREFLLKFAGWEPTPLEQIEKLEQLRAIEHNVEIALIVVDRAVHGIDTPEQYTAFVRRNHAPTGATP